MKNEVKPAEESIAEARKRPAKPGMVRVVVYITQERYDRLEAMAKEESPVFPRPVNEYLSILIDRKFEAMA